MTPNPSNLLRQPLSREARLVWAAMRAGARLISRHQEIYGDGEIWTVRRYGDDGCIDLTIHTVRVES